MPPARCSGYASTAQRGEQDVLIVLRTEDLSIVKVNQLPDEKNVGRFEWVNDTRLVFNSIRKFGRYAQPFGTGEWYGVNADGSQPPPWCSTAPEMSPGAESISATSASACARRCRATTRTS